MIEVDGGQHAESADDDRRTALLANNGYRVIRFWNNDVLVNIDGVLEAILATIEQGSPPTPNPSPPPCSAFGCAGREGGEPR